MVALRGEKRGSESDKNEIKAVEEIKIKRRIFFDFQ